MNKYFVKFVGWNENTISSLINKTIKFSTVYDFNDFNEYRYIGGLDSICSNTPGILDTELAILDTELANPSFLNNFQTLSAERCNKEYQKKIASFLKEGKIKQLLDPKENCLSLLKENRNHSPQLLNILFSGKLPDFCSAE